MRLIHNRIIYFVVFMWSFCVISKSLAQEVELPELNKHRYLLEGKKLRFGRLTLLPSFVFRNIYDDNALYDNNSRMKDDIVELRPGIDTAWHGNKMDWMLGYKFNYHKNIRADIQDYLAHDFGTEMYTTPFSKRVHIRLSDYLKDSAEPADAELLEKLHIFSNEASAEIGYITHGEDLEFTLGYVNNYRNYDGITEGSNFYGNGIELRSKVNLSSKYRFLPKTQATFDFNYTKARQNFGVNIFGREVSSDGYRFMTGITGAFSKKMSLTVRVGYANVGFDIGQKASEFATDLGINYSLSRKIGLSAGYSRSVGYSIYSPYAVINGYNVGIGYVPGYRLKINLKLDIKDLHYSRPADNGGGNQRKDLNTILSLETAYRLKEWLSIQLGYRLENRGTNLVAPILSSGDFLRNTIYLGIGLNHF